MSAFSTFHLSILYKADAAYYFGVELASALAGVAMPPNPLHASKKPEDIKALFEYQSKVMHASTRNDWFKECMKVLLNLSGYESLRFLSGQSSTYSCLHVEVHPEYKTEAKEMREYTLIEKRDTFDKVIEDLKGLTAWCLAHPVEAGAALEADAEDFPRVVEDAYFTLDPTLWAPGDEGEGADFLFCVLRTVGDLLRYARANGMWAVYSNEQYARLTGEIRLTGHCR